MVSYLIGHLKVTNQMRFRIYRRLWVRNCAKINLLFWQYMLLLSQNIKIERCILILGINIEPDDLADLRKSINRLDVYCAASSG